MTSLGNEAFVDKMLYVNGKPVQVKTPGDDPTLSQVLTAGNSAPGQEMFVGKVTAGVNSDLHVNSDINADTMECSTLGAVSVVASDSVNALTVNATNVFGVAELIATDITSTGVINWTEFVPPLVVSGTPGLSQVLGASSSGGNNDITAVNVIACQRLGADVDVITGSVECNQASLIGNPLVGGDAVLNIKTTDATTTAKIDFTGVAGQTQDTFIEGDTTINNGQPKLTKCTYLDLTDSTNTFPSVVAGDLAATLTLGNNAGTTGIDMNNQAINNALSVGATAVQALTGSFTVLNASSASVNGTTTAFSGLFNMNASTGGTSKLDFTGVSGQAQDTFIEGDDTLTISGLPKRTICTYLDLTDTTNLFTPSEQERYEWGGYWENPLTTINSGPQYLSQVFIGNNENTKTGWRFFRPMSDGEDQLPGFDSNIPKYDYIPYAADPTNPLLAFYVKTAPTTVVAHSSQLVQLSFPVTRYGYGRIYMGLYYVPDATPSATPVLIEQSYRLLTENIAQPGLADLRKGGHIMMEWVLKDVFPTDGTVWRIYPVFRTDDSEEYGAMEIRIGNANPWLGKLPTPGPQNGQLSMYGRPWSQSYTVYSPTYVWPPKDDPK